jgi:hypothetical protein
MRGVNMILEKTPFMKAERLLKALYEARRQIKPVYVPDVAYQIGLSQQEAKEAWTYLKEKKFIKTFSLPFAAVINEAGIGEVENPVHFSETKH